MSRQILPSNIIHRRYLLPITQSKVNVSGKFGICFAKCRKDSKVVYYVDLERRVAARRKPLFDLLNSFLLIIIENVHVKASNCQNLH